MATKQRARRWREAVPLHGNWEYKIRVKGTVIDIHGVDWVSVKVSGQSTKKVNLHDEKMGTFDKSYNVDWGRSIGGGYDIKVNAGDVNGNVAKYKTHMDGVLEAFINLVMKLLTALLEAVLALLTMFIDWIWNAIRGMVNYAFRPIKNAINDYVKGVASSFQNAINSYQETGNIQTSKINKIWSTLSGGTFGNVVGVLLTILDCVLTLISPFLSLVSGLLSDVSSFIGNIIINGLGIGKKDRKEINSLDEISNLIKEENPSSKSSSSSIPAHEMLIILVLIIGLICGVAAALKGKKSSKLLVGTGIFFSLAGIALGLLSYVSGPLTKYILSTAAVAASGIGFIFVSGGKGMLRNLGMIISGIGIVYGLWQLVNSCLEYEEYIKSELDKS